MDSEGKQIGILDRFAALQNSREQGLDLVEIAPRAIPPVAKIVDFNKFLYQEEKRKREEKKKAKVSETKEVRLGPFISDNDLGVMVKRAREFLLEGDKVRFVVKFRGRQVTRPEFGFATARKAIAMLEDISKVEREPHMEGRQLVAIISFERKKHEKKAENEKSSSQTV